jgi:tRNA U34 2-thiouridine synthase MnmA/TrmU
MFKKTKAYMEKTGSAFIFTGEVLDQRPMSQRRKAMDLIDREAGVEGLVVRPLCGGLLPPTIPEETGLIKREWLLKIRGRSRKPQMAMAQESGIDYYPCPAGGCLLTDPSFAPRVRDLLAHSDHAKVNDLHILRYGRHFRLSQDVKAVVGRSEEDNGHLEKLSRKGDLILETVDHPGPLTLVRGALTPEDIHLAARIHARYSDADGEDEIRVAYRLKEQDGQMATDLTVKPAPDEEVQRLRL